MKRFALTKEKRGFSTILERIENNRKDSVWKKPSPEYRRAAPRFPVRWPARAVQMGRTSFVIIKNVSEGGFLLTVPRNSHFLENLPTVVNVKFMGQSAKFSGRLCYYAFTEEDQCFGFEFGHLTPKNQAILDEWLEVVKNTPVKTSRSAKLLNAVTNWIKKAG